MYHYTDLVDPPPMGTFYMKHAYKYEYVGSIPVNTLHQVNQFNAKGFIDFLLEGHCQENVDAYMDKCYRKLSTHFENI